MDLSVGAPVNSLEKEEPTEFDAFTPQRARRIPTARSAKPAILCMRVFLKGVENLSYSGDAAGTMPASELSTPLPSVGSSIGLKRNRIRDRATSSLAGRR